MQKSKIEWTDYSLNPIKGLCPVACPYCYARRMYKRFRWDETIRYDNDVWNGFINLDHKPRQHIFVGSTFELFGEWVKQEWLEQIFRWVRGTPEHTFIFLTKQPQNLPREFPPNCWVGVSATNDGQYMAGLKGLEEVNTKVKFLSFEPLLEEVINNDRDHGFCNPLSFYRINWIIIGAQTPYSVKTAPRIEWVKELIEAADKVGIPYFLKNNLRPVMGNNLVQEFPSCGQQKT